MFSMFIILTVLYILSIPFFVRNVNMYTTIKLRKGNIKKYLWLIVGWVIFVIILAVLLVGNLVIQSNITIGDSEQFHTVNNRVIYYDKQENVYFTTEISNWNFINLVDRTIIDEEFAKKAIKTSQEYESLVEEFSERY